MSEGELQSWLEKKRRDDALRLQLRALVQRPVAVGPLGGSRELGARLGFYETTLPDGSLGYHMRRSDDCLQAAIATYLQCDPSQVPDLRLDAQLREGRDPEEISLRASRELSLWLARHGLTARVHNRPPRHASRWIGVAPSGGPTFSDHCLVMTGSRVLHDPVSLGPEGDAWLRAAGFSWGEIDYGITLD